MDRSADAAAAASTEDARFRTVRSSTCISRGKVAPVLRIHPGDTVRTWSVDAGGRDKQGNRRSAGGNPQTGPFFVEGALPNDTLVVRLNRVRTNRDWAQSGSTIMRNALEPGTLGSLTWDQSFNSRWRLDAAGNVAVLEKPTDSLKNFVVPLQPMLGCVAVAPAGRIVGAHHRFGTLRREHGLQPDSRGDDDLPSGFASRRTCCSSETGMPRRATVS